MALQELAGVHVLVVEDTDDSREMLRIALEYCGALVTIAESVDKAKRILQTLRPHVLVSDIAMPDNGLEMIREVKRLAETNDLHIPTIAITAYRGRRQELLAEGFAELRREAARSHRFVRGGKAARPASDVTSEIRSCPERLHRG